MERKVFLNVKVFFERKGIFERKVIRRGVPASLETDFNNFSVEVIDVKFSSGECQPLWITDFYNFSVGQTLGWPGLWYCEIVVTTQ